MGARSGPPALSVVSTGLFPTTLSDSANPADGLPAWATPADPSSAPTAAAMTSSVSSPSVPAPAPANPASSPRSPPTDLGHDVIGVVSFGPGTCSGKPGVFTEVSAYRSW